MSSSCTPDETSQWQLPRFPQTFLDRLKSLVRWEDVLSLVSVDRREAPMRLYWLREHSIVVFEAVGYRHLVDAFAKKLHGRCAVWQTVQSSRTRIYDHVYRLSVECNASLDRWTTKVWLLTSLVSIEFGRTFKERFSPAQFPASLRHLAVNSSRDLAELPTQLESLELGNFMWDIQLSRLVLPHLTELKFGTTRIISRFNEPLDHVSFATQLPRLERMDMFAMFDRPLPPLESWPLTLTSLRFAALNQQLVAWPNLRELVLEGNFTRPLAETPLPALERLVLRTRYEAGLSSSFIAESSLTLPRLTELVLANAFNNTIAPDVLPPLLKRLEFGASFDVPCERIALSGLPLEVLSFGFSFNQRLLDDWLPESLTALSFGTSFCGDLPERLPPRLQTLSFGASFNRPIDRQIARDRLPFLRLLTVGFRFAQSISRTDIKVFRK
jgi:hypothetical protein